MLPQTVAAYLRLSTAEGEPLPPLRAVVAPVTGATKPPERRWLRLSPTEQATNRYTFFADARLTVDRARLELPERNTLLELGYEPQTFVFLSRGSGPYMVAYGSPTAPPSAFDENAFETTLAVDTLLQTLPRSRAGAPFELAGSAASAPTAQFAWRRVVLWVSLVAGVGMLGVVAFGLIRQLDASAK